MVVPVRSMNSNEWAFLRPFTAPMWAVTAIFFVIIGAVVWIFVALQENKSLPFFGKIEIPLTRGDNHRAEY